MPVEKMWVHEAIYNLDILCGSPECSIQVCIFWTCRQPGSTCKGCCDQGIIRRSRQKSGNKQIGPSKTRIGQTWSKFIDVLEQICPIRPASFPSTLASSQWWTPLFQVVSSRWGRGIYRKKGLDTSAFVNRPWSVSVWWWYLQRPGMTIQRSQWILIDQSQPPPCLKRTSWTPPLPLTFLPVASKLTRTHPNSTVPPSQLPPPPPLPRHRAINFFIPAYQRLWIEAEEYSFEEKLVQDLAVSTGLGLPVPPVPCVGTPLPVLFAECFFSPLEPWEQAGTKAPRGPRYRCTKPPRQRSVRGQRLHERLSRRPASSGAHSCRKAGFVVAAAAVRRRRAAADVCSSGPFVSFRCKCVTVACSRRSVEVSMCRKLLICLKWRGGGVSAH